MEFENYERELKYLIKGILSLEEVLKVFYDKGYKLVETRTNEKHETYYDDNNLTVLKRGDVMRGSKHITEQFNGFLYKKNMCEDNKPYVSKLELGTKLRGQYKDVNEFIKELDLDVRNGLRPVLYAKMMRYVGIIEKNSDRLYVTYDKVKYYEKEETDSVYEDMLEIEDWIKPNTTTGDYNYDEHLLTANKIILNSSLPVELTKDSKYFRGYTLINKK